MAKKTKKESKPQVQDIPAVKERQKLTLLNFRVQALILAVIGLILYSNTFLHEYAFDDIMAITDNNYVQQGSAGIKDILTKDAFQSYQEQRGSGNQLAGGRYRPLSLITFAIEQQALGVNGADNSPAAEENKENEKKVISDMHVRHVVNVLLYILSVITVLLFLREVIFRDQPIIAFIAALLFLVHPLHTEVVANVKSRDEILSILFISLTFIQAFRYKDSRKTKNLVGSLVCFFLALLSKEYAALMIFFLPMSFYIFSKEDVNKSLRSSLPFAIPFILYMLMRFAATSGPGDEAIKTIQNYPYLYATGVQHIASEVLVLFRYLQLLVFPHPLVADYSYRQLPYSDFGNPMVWVSILTYTGIAVAGALLIKRRNVLGFALAFYLLNLLLVSNIFFNVGAPMGERLAYHSSLGFAIVIAYLLVKGTERLQPLKTAHTLLAAIVVAILLLAGYTTIARNPDWKNNETLFLKDIKTSPNSALMNINAGAASMKNAKDFVDDTVKCQQWFATAIHYFTIAIKLDSLHMLPYIDRGICYFNSGYADKALADWDTVRKYQPYMPALSKYLSIAGKYYLSQGVKYGKENKIDSAIISFTKAADAVPRSGEAWLFLTKANMDAGHYTEARNALTQAAKILPGNPAVATMTADLNKRSSGQ